MDKHLPHSIFVFEANKLHCEPCIEKLKKHLLQFDEIVDVDADLENQTVTIKGDICIVKLIRIIQRTSVNAQLIYYKKERSEDHDQMKGSCGKKENDCSSCSDHHEGEDICANCQEKQNMCKDHDQRKESRGKKVKECSCDDDEAEKVGADHYRKSNTFKDHKPEAYVPPKKAYYSGDVQFGRDKKVPMMPGAGSRSNAAYPNYHGLYYPAPWPQAYYM